jgi:hypothetical protein
MPVSSSRGEKSAMAKNSQKSAELLAVGPTAAVSALAALLVGDAGAGPASAGDLVPGPPLDSHLSRRLGCGGTIG